MKSLPVMTGYALFRYLRARAGDRRPFGCSLAPTIRCNLTCRHCYEARNRGKLATGAPGRAYAEKKELNKEQFAALVDKLYDDGIRHCTLTDGEPLLDNASVEKCEAAVNRFWVTYIVTNGTREIVDFPASYVLSLDGPEKVHDSLRGNGIFRQLAKHVKGSPTDRLYALCTMSTLNTGHIAETVETARSLGLRGIMFNWHTPFSHDDPLWLPYEQRNRDIDKVLALKETHGSFIMNGNSDLSYLRNGDWSADCPHWYVVSYDGYGDLKEPCVFNGALCERCGCHVYPSLKETIVNFRRTPQSRMIMDYVLESSMGLR